jgi:hypothetical protein
MGGGLMQLVAYGAQDIYLTGNPQITFFKVVYRRHTNFSVEAVEQTFNGNVNFGMKNVVCQIARVGDLVTNMYLKCNVSAGTNGGNDWAWCANLGHAMIDEVELEIGGTRIDRQYGQWMEIWHQLARNPQHDRGYDQMIGNTSGATTMNATHDAMELFVPLQFFCCRNDGLALPLIALQYHDVRVNFSFRPLAQCVNSRGSSPTDPSISSASLLVDYVYLDSEERKRFAQASHEYLIETLQYTGAESVHSDSAKPRLGMNHPNKALFWVTALSKLRGDADNWGVDADDATKRFLEATASSDVDGYTDNSGANLTDGEALNSGSADAAVTAIFDSLSPTQADGNVSYRTALNETQVEALAALGVVGATTVYAHNNFSDSLYNGSNPTANAQLQLNGHDRFSRQSGNYFNFVQPFQHFSNTPSNGVNVYSFALNPEDHQPSGTCNMSRIDNATLSVNYASSTDGDLCVYGLAYNVLRIMSGMGGLAYSN